MLKILKNPYFIACIILLAVLVIAFSNIIFFNQSLTTSTFTVGTTRTGPYLYNGNRPPLPITDGAASAWHFEPAMQLNNQAYRNGQLPLWNAYNGAGQPIAADLQSSSFYPIAFPLILNPSPVMWDFFLIFRLFIAGLFMFIFLRLINLKVISSIAGAITFMLSGYFVFFVNMAHLNVEILIPLFLLSIEFLYQRKNLISIGLIAIASALVIMGGMPESSVVTFIFGGAYFVFRAFKEYKEKTDWSLLLKSAVYFSFGILAGLSISSITWAPFLEYSNLFWSKHIDKATGSVALNPYFTVQFLAPRFLSALHNTTYIGVIPLLLIFGTNKNHKYKWFFIISALVIGLKVFGIGINWIGYLPLLKRIYLFKYSQAPLAFSLAALTAIAVDSGFKTKWWRISLVGIIWAGAYYFFFKFSDFFVKNKIILDGGTKHAKLSLVFLVLASAIILVPKLLKKPKEVYVASAITFLIFVELWLHIPTGRADRFNPYIAPPFVKFLQKQEGLFRTYGADGVLWPNTNAAYKIQDIRSLNAVQPMNYMTYLSLFSDLTKLGHITGLEGINLESQFFDALNVRYVASLKPFNYNLDWWLERKEKLPATKIGEEIWFPTPLSAKFKFPQDVKFLNFKVQAKEKQTIKISAVKLGGSIGLNESSMNQITVSKKKNDRIQKNKLHSIFKQDIEAGTSSLRVNISDLAGQGLRLTFSGNALINSVHYSSGGDLSKKFKLVFIDSNVEPAVTVYENKRVMPRVIVYDDVKIANYNPLGQLKKMNIREKALVETPVELKDKKKLKYNAKVTLYQPQKIKIKVKTNKRSLLVLADTYYPGWKAYVNGVEKKIIKTNLMFRGVVIDSSTKQVVITYEPAVYKTGFRLTGAAMLALLALSLAQINISRRKRAN